MPEGPLGGPRPFAKNTPIDIYVVEVSTPDGIDSYELYMDRDNAVERRDELRGEGESKGIGEPFIVEIVRRPVGRENSTLNSLLR